MRASSRRVTAQRWFGTGRFALVWAAVALAVTIGLAIRTPPLQVADEGAHVMRALQLADGGVLGRRIGDGAGGSVPASFLAFDRATWRVAGIAPVPASQGWRAGIGRLQWGSAQDAAVFSNTVLYPPTFYAVSVAAIAGARSAGMSVLASIEAVRIANGVSAVAIAAAAIASAASGRLLLAALLGLPMTLSLFGSCSQDCLLIAGMAACAAFLTRDGHRDGWRDAAAWAAAALVMASACGARPPYLALVPLLPLSTRGARAPRKAWAAAVGAAAVGAAWIALAQSGNGTHGMGVQLAWLRRHPGAVPMIAWNTLRLHGMTNLREFVGVLGWLDVPLPGVAVLAAGGMLGIAVVRDLGGGPWIGAARAAGMAICLVLAAGLVYGALYLSWTRVGDSVVDGVQGRYFLPIAMFVVLMLPRRRRERAAGWEAVVLGCWMSVMGGEAMHRIAVHFPIVASARSGPRPVVAWQGFDRMQERPGGRVNDSREAVFGLMNRTIEECRVMEARSRFTERN